MTSFNVLEKPFCYATLEVKENLLPCYALVNVDVLGTQPKNNNAPTGLFIKKYVKDLTLK